jgi:DNA-binding GntR family transcriptional regulator
MRRHQQILAACLAGDGALARRATVIHLRETADMFISELERTPSRAFSLSGDHSSGLAGRGSGRRS